MSFSVKTEGLSKKYVIGHQRQERYDTFRDMLMHKARGLGQRLRHPLSPNAEEIELEELWALKDVNLEIQPGEKVGIIGRNGAGKTTLLKLLSRITEPSEGYFTINGRVSSLLEVGTGFHPELTGRENIFLNGAILGMSRAEIKSRFDEIVDFSDVERFLDTPVKRYSSGMYVRLAFAVAAHLEPEVLLVDEVLAVGDLAFQRKCLGKMEEVASSGRTILFISHNMAAIESLCTSCVIVRDGRISDRASPKEAVTEYASWHNEISHLPIAERTDRQGDGDLRLASLEILNSANQVTTSIPVGRSATIRFKISNSKHSRYARVVVGVYDQMHTGILRFDTEFHDQPLSLSRGANILNCHLDELPLAPGSYFLNVAIYEGNVMQDYLQRALTFSVVPADFFKNGRFITPTDAGLMKVLLRHSWKLTTEHT